jgi:hypothetical protein
LSLPNRTYDMYIAENEMPDTADDALAFRLRAVPSVIYTLVLAFIKVGESFDSGGAQ